MVKGALPSSPGALARDHGHEGIRVNVIEPGIIRTRFHHAMTPEAEKNNLDNRIPLHRFGKPEDVASASVELLTNPVHHRRDAGDRRRHVDAHRVTPRPLHRPRFRDLLAVKRTLSEEGQPMYQMPDGTKLFVVDAHTHLWDARPENLRNRYGQTFIDVFWASHNGLTPGRPALAARRASSTTASRTPARISSSTATSTRRS